MVLLLLQRFFNITVTPTLVGHYNFENNFENSQKDIFFLNANPGADYIYEVNKYGSTLTYTDGVQGYAADFDGDDTYTIPKKL